MGEAAGLGRRRHPPAAPAPRACSARTGSGNIQPASPMADLPDRVGRATIFHFSYFCGLLQVFL